MSINAKKIYRLTGLSTDVKPIFDDIATGSTFEETDTGVVFVYNTDLGQWISTKATIEPASITSHRCGINTKKIYHLTGLSTDTKPVPVDIATGSTYIENDTGTVFVYNRSINDWVSATKVPEPVVPVEPVTPAPVTPDEEPDDESDKPVTDRAVYAPCIGILSIDLTSSSGLVDTYTIKYTNGSSTTFNVTNGTPVTPYVISVTAEDETLIFVQSIPNS